MDGKLKRRFYEPLVLSHALSHTQGDRIGEELATWGEDPLGREIKSRREVLRQLCRACDYEKGGETIASMALEKTPQGPVYWISMKDSKCERALPFLRRLLDTLHTGAESITTLRAMVLEQTTDFAASRIRDHCRFLEKELTQIHEMLQTRAPLGGHSDIQDWITDLLRKIAESKPLAICELLYAKIRGGEMQQQLEALKKLQSDNEENWGLWLQHYMGRLASTVRASRVLSRMSRDHSYLFDDYTLKDVRIPCDQRWPAPGLSRKYTLEAVAGRMLRVNSPDLPGLINDLQRLERTMSPSLTEEIRKIYHDSTWKLKVHAELALLEAVHSADIDFYDDDKYIACSKGACFCCYQYICHHPGRFVKPASHNNIWLNWAPPLIPNGGSEGAGHQRKLLNKIVDEIRHNAMEQVRNKSGSRRWQPDSTTGMAKTVTEFTLIENDRRRSSSTDSVRVQLEPEPASHDPESPLQLAIESDSDDGGIAVDLVAAQISNWQL